MDDEFQSPGFFDERMTHPKATAIDAPKHIEFDWELLRRLLGEARTELGEHDYTLLGHFVGELLRWQVKDWKSKGLKRIGRRAVALAWTVNPDIFEGLSASQLAVLLGLSKKPHAAAQKLSEDTADASRTFKQRNRSQRHASNFKNN